MGTVTIGSDTFDVYGTHALLASYAAGSYVHGDTFTAATTTQQDRALVEATRLLVAQTWLDTANAVVGTAAAAVIQAAQELALAGLADAAVFTQASASLKVRSVDAKGVGVEFFSPTAVGRFPVRVMDLISALLDGGGNDAPMGSTGAGGTDAESDFDDDAYTLIA
jgi:hypothetical protein